MKSYAEVETRLRDLLTERSFEHSRRTAAAAARLAKKHNEDVALAEMAGLVHDVARDLTNEELLSRARALGHTVHHVEEAHPYLLHAMVGAAVLAEKTGLDDPRITKAVERHTFGAPGMTNLEKVVYLADMLEPGRQFVGVEELRVLAEQDLSAAFMAGFKRQLGALVAAERFLHPCTLDVWNVIVEKG